MSLKKNIVSAIFKKSAKSTQQLPKPKDLQRVAKRNIKKEIMRGVQPVEDLKPITEKPMTPDVDKFKRRPIE